MNPCDVLKPKRFVSGAVVWRRALQTNNRHFSDSSDDRPSSHAQRAALEHCRHLSCSELLPCKRQCSVAPCSLCVRPPPVPRPSSLSDI